MQDIYRMMEERSSREFAPEGEFDKQAWAERKQSERQEAFDRADAAALRANSDPAALETYMRVAAQLPAPFRHEHPAHSRPHTERDARRHG